MVFERESRERDESLFPIAQACNCRPWEAEAGSRLADVHRAEERCHCQILPGAAGATWGHFNQYWLVVWLPFFAFSHILGIIIPIDSYFSEGWPNHQPEYMRHIWGIYPLVNEHRHGKSPLFVGISTITGPCSIAMLVDRRVSNGNMICKAVRRLGWVYEHI